MLNIVRIWILLSALLVASGWILSAFHQLNSIGYGIIFALAAITFFFWQQQTKWRPKINLAQCLHKFRRRFKRSAPLIFLALALLTLLAGALYVPSNGSSTTYRIPRVMHWLAAGQWHWIRTIDVRINIAGCGFEWFFAPLILLTKSDRLLFLINWLPFLLLPGLIFSVFTRLGVRGRVAWWWMWLLPTGWCFILQASSTLNDAFATAYALAAVDFALRARENKNVGDVWLAMLAAALATGVKQTDILLALPGLIAIWPSVRLLFKQPLLSSAIVSLCLLISALPMMFFDYQHTGSWAGVTADSWGNTGAEMHSPFWGVIGNIFCLTVQNLKPPVFPFVNSWHMAMIHFLQTPFGGHFAGFEAFGRISFGVGESSAALGAGIFILILVSFFAARHYGRTLRTVGATKNPDKLAWLLRWTPWLLLLLFMAKVGTFENGRQMASYYILLFPALLANPGQSVLVRRRWWRLLALAVMTVAVMLLVISRDRPLFPSQTIVGWLEASHPNSKLVSNISRTYSTTPDVENQRLFVRKILPPDETILGFAAVDGLIESHLWLPYGQRRVQRILPGDAPEQSRLAGIHYVVLEKNLLIRTSETLEQWLARYNGVVIQQWDFVANPYDPPQHFYLVHLQNP